MGKLFNVFIVDDKTTQAVSMIGQNLREPKAEQRADTGWQRINPVDFSVEVVEAKSQESAKFIADLDPYGKAKF